MAAASDAARERNDLSKRPAWRARTSGKLQANKTTHDGGRVSKNQAGTLARASRSTTNFGFRNAQCQ